jgi:glycosyltransferase involved in cell wall biosynthesis
MMRVLVATDAWHPQVNGVVRTLSTLAATAPRLGADISFLTHEGFRTFPLPTYADIRCALPAPWTIARRIAQVNPEAIHIATEGTIGHAVRRYCIRNGIAFTTSFHTRLPEYVAARAPIPESLVWHWLRRFHGRAERVMVSTRSLIDELSGRGFRNPVLWPRGVDGEVFSPRDPMPLDVPRPIFLTVCRVAVEKNIEAFLSLDLPGTKVVVGEGPMRQELMQRFPQALFLGEKHRDELAAIYSAADVFVFPSRTDTFGLVMLEALSCGVPVAAYPVPGPLDVVGNSSVGVLDENLQSAALRALAIDRAACRTFASTMTWDRCARMFLDNLAILPRSATAGERTHMHPAARIPPHARRLRGAFTTEATGAPARPDPAIR